MTDYHQVQEEQQEQQGEFTNPYSMFVYAIRSPYTKESYFRRLRRFFDTINFCEGETMEKRCNTFGYRGRNDSNWAFSNILKFLYSQKERVDSDPMLKMLSERNRFPSPFSSRGLLGKKKF